MCGSSRPVEDRDQTVTIDMTVRQRNKLEALLRRVNDDDLDLLYAELPDQDDYSARIEPSGCGHVIVVVED